MFNVSLVQRSCDQMREIKKSKMPKQRNIHKLHCETLATNVLCANIFYHVKWIAKMTSTAEQDEK